MCWALTAVFDVDYLTPSSENPMQQDFHYHHFTKEENDDEREGLNMPVTDTCPVCVCVCVCVLNLVIYYKSHNADCKHFEQKWTK